MSGTYYATQHALKQMRRGHRPSIHANPECGHTRGAETVPIGPLVAREVTVGSYETRTQIQLFQNDKPIAKLCGACQIRKSP